MTHWHIVSKHVTRCGQRTYDSKLIIIEIDFMPLDGDRESQKIYDISKLGNNWASFFIQK